MEQPEQVLSPRPNFTRLSKGIVLLLAALFLVGQFIPSSRQWIALVPGRSVNCAWAIVTSSFLETSWLGLILSSVTLLLVARSAEPVHGTKEFLKVILIAAVASGSACLVVQYARYFLYRVGKDLFRQYAGFHGIAGALFIVVKHVTPGSAVSLGPVHVPTRYLPLLYLAACCAYAYVVGASKVLPFAIAGVYSSWFYLRFVQRTRESGARGDPSDDFALSTIFPPPLEAPLDVAFGLVSSCFCMHSRSTTTDQRGSTESAPPRTQDKSAARHRDLANKALDARLALSSTEAKPKAAPTSDDVVATAQGGDSKV